VAARAAARFTDFDALNYGTAECCRLCSNCQAKQSAAINGRMNNDPAEFG